MNLKQPYVFRSWSQRDLLNQLAFSSLKDILYVDNSPDDCDLLRFVLEQAGYSVAVACTLLDGLQAIDRQWYALYVFDLNLPDGSGFQLIERVRKQSATVPILICSGDARPSTRDQVLQTGASGFFSKPIDLDEFTEKVIQLISLP